MKFSNFEIAFYSIIFFPIAIITIKQMKKIKSSNRGIVGAFSGLMFGFFLYYSLIPIITIFNINMLDANRYGPFYKYIPHIRDKEFCDFLFAALMVYIALFIIITSYNQTVKKYKYQGKNVILDYDINLRVYKLVKIGGLFSFVIGGLSLLGLMTSLGGIGRSLFLAEAIRQHNTELSNFTNLYFLYVPTALIQVSPYAFYYCYEFKKSMNNLLLMVMSFVVLMLYFLFNAGRAPILLLIISFLYIFLMRYLKEKKYIWRIIFSLALIGFPALTFMDNLFFWMQGGSFSTVSFNLFDRVGEFAGPFTLILNAKSIVKEFGYKFFLFIPQDIISLLPGFEFPVSYENTSEYISGIYWSNTGGTPNDIITLGYIQMGLIGVVLICYFIGWLAAKMDLIVGRISENVARVLFGIILAEEFWGVISSADLRPILQNGFTFVALILILVILNRNFFHIGKHIKIVFRR